MRASLVRPVVYRHLPDSSVRMVLSKYEAKSLSISPSLASAKKQYHNSLQNNESVVFTRFSQPINPTLDDTEIWIDLAGGGITTQRVASGEESITGDVSATVRYTLMSVDWNPFSASVTWDNPPVPGASDPTIDVDHSEIDQGVAYYQGISTVYGNSNRAFSRKFENCENKLYYGIKAEIINFEPGTKTVRDCAGTTWPTEFWVEFFWRYVPSCDFAPPECEAEECQAGSETGFSYFDSNTQCTAYGTATSTGDCVVECYDAGYGLVYAKSCKYTVNVTSIVPLAKVGITESIGTGSFFIISKRPRVEIPVVSRSATAGVARITLGSPHGLKYTLLPGVVKGQSPTGVEGIDDTEPLQILTVSSVGGSYTFTVSGAHGMVVGQMVHVFGAGPLDGHLFLTAKTTNSFTVYIAGGQTMASRPWRGWARPSVYDMNFSRTLVPVTILSDTVLEYPLYLPATFSDASKACGGYIYMG